MNHAMAAAARLINWISDFLILLLSFTLSYFTFWFFGNSLPDQFDTHSLSIIFFVFYIANYFSLSFSGAYPTTRLRSYGDMAAIYLKSVFMAFIAVAVIAYFVYPSTSSRSLLLSSSIYAFLLLLCKELGMRWLLGYLRGRGFNIRNAVLVGQNERLIKETVREIENNHLIGLKVVGIVSINGEDQKQPHHLPNLGRIEDLIKIVEENIVDNVIFLAHGPDKNAIEKALWQCEERGLEVWLRLDLLDRPIFKAAVTHLRSIPFLQFQSGPQNTGALMMKYALDRILSFALLIIFSPLFVIISIVIKITSQGPIIFKQYRGGLNGRKFLFFKFRTMITDAEQRRESLKSQNEMQGPVFKIKDDPRVTPMGRFLRKTSLDELPQLWNVLKGDMSLVGPRPLPLYEVKEFKGWQRRRLSMKPGITCIWQTSGRNNVTKFDDWASMDLQYIDNWSLWLDLKILFQTIPAVLISKGAR
ncbi:MAG: hypothetical protein A3C35_08340 [Omnitrophica bacterium RIFCSPHIGHO2_02_FULL_46_11]|nr:MAG: hypothetical protein A3A81_02220 [Omnitrophica bacterium RIFCSPLOWO2_01_FULL_45_10b]OGW86553.1 MAG: hypothetical protein A3C35_08340 [Omnitrophica bacterium RIFCSPHIGHO2_02_FULL_46_11]